MKVLKICIEMKWKAVLFFSAYLIAFDSCWMIGSALAFSTPQNQLPPVSSRNDLFSLEHKLSISRNNNDFNHHHHFSSTSLSLLSSSSSSPPSSSMSDLQRRLQTQTIIRIAIPSLAAALLCYITFPLATNAIYTYVETSYNGVESGTGYEALNLILTDNSNQFIQNAHNILALNFCFLTSSTFSFLYNNQVKLYDALFEEVSVLISLLEQTALSTEGRSKFYRLLLLTIQKYVNDDLKVVTTISDAGRNKNDIDEDNETNNIGMKNIAREDLPSILVSQRPQDDPLEAILYLTSVGQPSYIYSTIKSLRQARAKRLASLQRKLPEINMYLLYSLGFASWVTFPIVTAGSSTVGGDALINLYRDQLSLGMVAMGLVLGILNELKQPEIGSAYNVDYSVLGTLIDGLEKELDYRLSMSHGDEDDYDYNSEDFDLKSYEVGDWSKDISVDDFGARYSYADDTSNGSNDPTGRTAASNLAAEEANYGSTWGREKQEVKSKKPWLGRRILSKIWKKGGGGGNDDETTSGESSNDFFKL